MTRKLQSALEDSRIEWPAFKNHIPCMAHVIQLAVGAFMSSLDVKGLTKFWEAHEHNQQFGQNESIDIRKSQRLRNEGKVWISKLSAMRPGLAKIMEKVLISRYFESPETDHHKAENAYCIDYTDTWSSKRVHWLSKYHSQQRSTTDYGCEDSLKVDTTFAWASLSIMRIHPQVAPKSTI